MEMSLLVSVFFAGSCTLALYLCTIAWLRMHRTREIFRRQGVDGPKPSFMSGNLSEMTARTGAAKVVMDGAGWRQDDGFNDYCKDIFPYFDQWRKVYGPTYLYWVRMRPALYVTDPALIREIGLCVSLDLGKPTYMQKGQEPLFGLGILKSNGFLWSRQRKIIAPEFYMDKVKGMVDLMVEAATPLLSSWEKIIDVQGKTGVLKIDEDVRSFSFDVISRACFGSDYSRGKQIFLKLKQLKRQMAAPSEMFAIHSLRFLPTEKNRKLRQLEQDIRSLILEVIEDRRALKSSASNSKSEKDFLWSILESTGGVIGDQDSCYDFIVDNCKNIYFAGHETTAAAAIWCLMLLAAHPDWQDRARAEVVEVCGGRAPDFEMINRMKTLTMIVQETLRLFPPSSFVVRETFRDMNFGRLHTPKGTHIFIPTSVMHHDASVWGADAHQFNPERFKNGVSSACKYPNVFMPFGLGARTCVGQNLAMMEVKTLLALILSKFAFELAPEYRHSPVFRLTIEPEFDVPLVMEKVQQSC